MAPKKRKAPPPKLVAIVEDEGGDDAAGVAGPSSSRQQPADSGTGEDAEAEIRMIIQRTTEEGEAVRVRAPMPRVAQPARTCTLGLLLQLTRRVCRARSWPQWRPRPKASSCSPASGRTAWCVCRQGTANTGGAGDRAGAHHLQGGWGVCRHLVRVCGGALLTPSCVPMCPAAQRQEGECEILKLGRQVR